MLGQENQYGTGIFSTEVLSFQMTLVCVKLTKILPGQWINTFTP